MRNYLDFEKEIKNLEQDLDASKNDYKRLLMLNDHVNSLFRENKVIVTNNKFLS